MSVPIQVLVPKLIGIQWCTQEMIADVEKMIDNSINEDIVYSSQPLDLRNQRTYAVKVGHIQDT